MAHVGPRVRAICSQASGHGGHRASVAPWIEGVARSELLELTVRAGAEGKDRD